MVSYDHFSSSLTLEIKLFGWWLFEPGFGFLFCDLGHFSEWVHWVSSLSEFTESVQWVSSVTEFTEWVQWQSSVSQFRRWVQWVTSVSEFSEWVHWISSVIQFSDWAHWVSSVTEFSEPVQKVSSVSDFSEWVQWVSPGQHPCIFLRKFSFWKIFAHLLCRWAKIFQNDFLIENDLNERKRKEGERRRRWPR